jgi:glycosyltransferase involved in cell wall biosynthesis
MAREPLVTVVTPVYNGEKYLVECIESVLAQTYLHWDYVIVNNRSTDRSLEIAERYAKKDPRITVMTTDRFLDVMGSQNTALRQISPDSNYCKMVHADDWLFPDCLRQMVELAEAHPSVGIVTSYRLDDVWVMSDGLPYPSTVIPGREICRRSLLGGPYVFGTPTSLMYRSDIIRDLPSVFDPADYHADTGACYELLRSSDFGFVHQVLSYTRAHPETQTSFADAMNTYAIGYLRHLKKYGPMYLTPKEYEQCLRWRFRQYYRFLGTALQQGRGKEFWRYHRKALEELGYSFSWARILAQSILRARNVLVHPLEALQIGTRWFARRKI